MQRCCVDRRSPLFPGFPRSKLEWFTVPVKIGKGRLISEIEIFNGQRLFKKFKNFTETNYSRSRYFKTYSKTYWLVRGCFKTYFKTYSWFHLKLIQNLFKTYLKLIWNLFKTYLKLIPWGWEPGSCASLSQYNVARLQALKPARLQGCKVGGWRLQGCKVGGRQRCKVASSMTSPCSGRDVSGCYILSWSPRNVSKKGSGRDVTFL